MSRLLRRVLTLASGVATVLASGPGFATVQATTDEKGLNAINHIVVIYEENHSFDNLYGNWPGVNGRANATSGNTLQVRQAGTAFSCLLQNDVNLTSPPQLADCTGETFSSHFTNQPFNIGAHIASDSHTCPQPGVFAPNGLTPSPTNLPGGCTRDMVHRFYQEQYQLNDGHQNRYTTGSDAAGLTQGYYDSTALPIYAYLHRDGASHYAIADDFFQSAFGGSFLNHQWLIAAATPAWPGIPDPQHSIVDTNGFPNGSYPLYTPTTAVLDRAGTQACGLPTTNPNVACGDYAVNTIQPAYQPFRGSLQLPAQTGATIGDRLSSAGVTWAWYSGGWSNADGDVNAPGWTNGTTFGACSDPDSSLNGIDATKWYCPNKVFQFHHQPFNYYANYAPGTPGRAHLQDEQQFINMAKTSAKTCQLNSVSFIKPIGLENEHPGYTSENRGSDHLVDLLSMIDNSACRKDTMVVVTYDEFGGQWDHVAPPGQGGTAGPHDLWGPGTRIPTLIIAPRLRGDFVVDHTQYDTTSILATIEHRYSLPPLSPRDAAVNDLAHVFAAKSPFDT